MPLVQSLFLKEEILHYEYCIIVCKIKKHPMQAFFSLEIASSIVLTIKLFSSNGGIGFSEELGAGTRKLYKYAPIYSGVSTRPHIMDGDVFRFTIPLDDDLPATSEQL